MRVVRIGALATVVALTLSTGASAGVVARPAASVGVATSTSVPASVLAAKFTNQFGASESLGALKGKTVLVVPLLTLCGDTCPFTSGNLLQVSAKAKAATNSNVVVVGVSVDPYRDTVARIATYSKLFGNGFQLWTPQGPATMPIAPKSGSTMNMSGGSASSVGTGDTNKNLTALEKFFGWTVQVVVQGTPPATDWMAPHEKLTYDINHSDGFWVINAKGVVRFESGTKPAFTGTLAKSLATFMGYKNNIYNSPVYKRGWTSAQAWQAIEWVKAQG